MLQLWKGLRTWIGTSTTLLVLCHVHLYAQGSPDSTLIHEMRTRASLVHDTLGHRGACHGEIISRIDVSSNAPFAPDGGPRVLNRIAKFASSLHSVTRPQIIRRYLTFAVGERCTDFERTESERILRAQPFLADASVRAVPDGSGGVILEVTTVDEVSLILDGDASTKAPLLRGLRLGEANFAGEAIYAVGSWQHGALYRDIYKGRIVDYQFLGKPYQLSLQGSRNEIGGSWDAGFSHPFFTDLQRISWRVTAGSSDRFLYFRRPNAEPAALRLVRQYSDVGGIYAFGGTRKHLLLGSSISRERERTGFSPVLVRDSAIVPDTSSVLIGRYGARRSTRINLFVGLRNISYMRVLGFDALEGIQDVRTGVQISTLFGKGIRTNSKDDRDFFISGDIYGGRGSPSSFVATELMGERRRNSDTREWDGMLVSGRSAWYVKPRAGNTWITGLEWSGGWNQRVPFQLTLSDPQGGLRGYGSSDLGGAQRLVARTEDVVSLGHLRQFATLGGVLFVHAGRLWAGDVPFGTNTGVKVSAGVGLLAALPPRSRRTWRMDLAIPLNDHHAKFEVRFTNRDFTQWFWREPGDVQTSRERSIPNSVYNWP